MSKVWETTLEIWARCLFPLYKLAEAAETQGLVGAGHRGEQAGKGPEGQHLHGGHRGEGSEQRKRLRKAMPCRTSSHSCLSSPFCFFALGAVVTAIGIPDDSSWTITSQGTLRRHQVLAPALALCSAEHSSADIRVGHEWQLCPAPPRPILFTALSVGRAGEHGEDVKDSISIHKTKSAASPLSPLS